MSTLERAIEIAATAHAGQQDKAGAPYILHPLRVMLAQKEPAQRIAAILHDVVEDTPWTLEQLRAEGFSDDVLSAVDALTKREGEDYFAFVDRAGRNPVARAVKIADIRDNMDVSRIVGVTDRDRERLEKYRQALTRLVAE
jgi:(p)ppGpp synthase/HD superfamily hydrolase